MAKLMISVIGASKATPREFQLAEETGKAIADAGCVLVCGGLSGVMEGAAKGSTEAGGFSVGILPQNDKSQANPHLSIALPTGLGHMRNYLVASAADGVIAIGGAAGTLSEIGMALTLGRPLVLLESLDVDAIGLNGAGTLRAAAPNEAVKLLLGILRKK